MFPNCCPCINISECKSLGGLSHHLVEERLNTKKGIIKKHVMLQHQKNRMLIEIKGYAMPAKHQLEMHIRYDD
jgi:hypothetical protein